jgi:hypothetical protein
MAKTWVYDRLCSDLIALRLELAELDRDVDNEIRKHGEVDPESLQQAKEKIAEACALAETAYQEFGKMRK